MGTVEREFRAYDEKEKALIYDQDLWLPDYLKKLGHTESPVHISSEGIHYTLNCLSNHYENDWEEKVIAYIGIDIMQNTNLLDKTGKKIFGKDIISFYPSGNLTQSSAKTLGRIQYSEQSGEWIIVNKHEQFLDELGKANQPEVIGNWFENAELLN
ncbi:YopX family protein [Desulfosporosinus sp. FKB]|uniref:YopX family protein n=1 Tax=Desulfosporosinus sp. FKB TaxID=1969835 RepID=UPI000B49928C|nr:YopX family protein [Desulfosporosinus sp. FKB]